MIQKFTKILCKLLSVIVGIMLGVMILSNVLEVIARYWFPDFTIIWVEDLSILGLFWIMALSLPVLWLEKKHLEMDVIAKVAPRKFLGILNILVNVVGMAGGVGAIYLGIKCVQVNRGYVLSVIGYDEALRYIPLIVLGAGLTLASLANLIEVIKGKGQYLCEEESQDG